MTPEQYHDGTKHHFHRFAPSLGYLDWASQPSPFRSFAGAQAFPLYPSPASAGAGYTPAPISYDDLYGAARKGHHDPPLFGSAPFGAELGDVLRHALGLSAWKQFRESRWALRVNPSSGNLHPTEAYVVAGPLPERGPTAGVYHYAPDRHALEQRAAIDADAWAAACGEAAYGNPAPICLIALTSIHWREAWKYGERAFRYCQHDMGHAVAAVRLASSLVGWTATLLPEWSHADIAALVGTDRDEDYVDAEREDPGCLLAITSLQSPAGARVRPQPLIDAARGGRWSGRASQLSEAHVDWKFIDDVARATADPGHLRPAPLETEATDVVQAFRPGGDVVRRPLDARDIVLQRRSAVAFDGRTSIARATFTGMLDRAMPGPGAPWDALWWTPRIHLALFVHRVEGVDPGLYFLPRDVSAVDRLKTAFGRDFLWEPADAHLPLVRLVAGDCRRLAQRLSCDQDIAADGCFSVGMIADFDASLREHGPSFYRHLFWESGVVGQVLYLEAEAAGVRATGIGCFYDDAVHDVLGITDHSFQSLYHFTVGTPVDDTRLTTEPGYGWER